jgi:hypothetical protein
MSAALLYGFNATTGAPIANVSVGCPNPAYELWLQDTQHAELSPT